MKNEILRNIPQTEKILQNPDISRFSQEIGRGIVTRLVQEEISRFRDEVRTNESLGEGDLYGRIAARCARKKREKLQRVINGTGVILHTNLGRAPIAKAAAERLVRLASGYCSLEIDLVSGQRGKRGGIAEELLCQLTGAEDALIVNNNAASVFLILSEFAKGREVIVSRGELIQIGGGFRIPDIMAQSGALLVEVGTTNITTIDDFRSRISGNTAMIFSAHLSNFRLEGFTQSPALDELAGLKNDSVLFVRDLGSGNLVFDRELPQPFEPTLVQELSQGPDLLCFSGDKLLGSCQAGVILGRRALISRLRKNPLMRMIRVDKLSYSLLESTLLLYANNRVREIPLWSMIYQTEEELARRASRLVKRLSSADKKERLKTVPCRSALGGGSMPGIDFPSKGIRITHGGLGPDQIQKFLLAEEPPVLGVISADGFILDMRTVFEEDLPDLSVSIDRLLNTKEKP